MKKVFQTEVPYTVQSDSNNLMKLVLKICLTSVNQIVSEPRKNLSSVFHQSNLYYLKEYD